MKAILVVFVGLVSTNVYAAKFSRNAFGLLRVCGIPVTHTMEKVPAALYYETKKDAKELDQPDTIVECTHRRTGRPAFVEVFRDGKATAWLFD